MPSFTKERKAPLAPLSASNERFPPARAFVIRLSSQEQRSRPTSGRVEHVLTGRSRLFDSLDGLSEFLGEVIAAEDTSAEPSSEG
jgi:hypothetical protein